MESPKLKIPKSFFDNFDTVVRYQNVQLIKAICEYKGWTKERENEIIECFFDGKQNGNKIKQSKVEMEKSPLETNSINKPKKLIRKKAKNHLDEEKIVYIQKPIEVEGKKYMLEDPTNNIYDVETNKFVGIYYKDNSGLGKINTRSQEN